MCDCESERFYECLKWPWKKLKKGFNRISCNNCGNCSCGNFPELDQT